MPDDLELPSFIYWIGLPVGIISALIAGSILLHKNSRPVRQGSSIKTINGKEWPDPRTIAAKKEEWGKAGYSKEMQERAIDWAIAWSEGMQRKLKLPEEYRHTILPEALGMADKWLRGFTEFVKEIGG